MNGIYKKVLIIGTTNSDLNYLKSLLINLQKKGVGFAYWGENQELLELFRENNWPFEKKKTLKLNKFTVATKLLWQAYYSLVYNSKLKTFSTGIDTTVFLLSNNTKLFLTPVITKNKIKLNWLELPTETASKTPTLSKQSKYANIVTFNSTDKHNLQKLGFGGTFKTLEPGIALQELKRQDSIFQGLARIDHPRRKFFTIGVITPLNNNRLETLYKAVARAREVVPNIQLVVVGGGPEKKTLMWLAKKMGIESSVWLVGEQKNHRKWLENLDLYLSINQENRLEDLFFTLEVMASKLPIIGNFGSGLDDLVFEGKNGYLTCMNDSEVIAQYIINIEQDLILREKLGKTAEERVIKHFNLEQMTAQFEKLI
jgi:glycosyltransferase involved in cell wall biosynthesis